MKGGSAGMGVDDGYKALRESAAWIDLAARGRIRAAGEDRARLLHAMTTQHVEQMRPGDGCYAFFLNAQGRILADVNLFCFEDHFLLDTEPEIRRKVFEHLDRYIIADDVTLADTTEVTAEIAIEGPGAAAVLEALGAELPDVPYSTKAWGERVIARVNSTGSQGFAVIFPLEGKEDFIRLLGQVPEATPEQVRTVRIEHGRPRYGEEITERYLVQETGQLNAVHFNKGCYLGQEIVERVRAQAKIHRVLRRLEIDSDQPPAVGTKLKSGEADAAEIVSSAYSPSLGKTVAMAYVRVAFADPGTQIAPGVHVV